MGVEFSRVVVQCNLPIATSLGPKINVVKQRCRSELFKMAEKSACRDFRKAIEHRPMEVQTK